MMGPKLLSASLIVLALACGACDRTTPTVPSSAPPGQSPGSSGTGPTYVLSGRVTEAGGGSLEGVTVAPLSSALRAVVSDASGAYRLSGVQPGRDWFNFTKPAFEPGYRFLEITSDDTIDVRLQRPIVMTAGDTVTATAYPDDPIHSTDWLDESACGPCKLIRVAVPRAGTLTVRLTMSAQTTALGLKVQADGFVAKEVGCCAQIIEGAFEVPAREVKVFVYRPGSSGGSQPFELFTALR